MDWREGQEGGVDLAEVAKAEARLGVEFPRAYRKMLAAHAGEESISLGRLIEPSELMPASETDVPEFDCVASWSRRDLARLIPIFKSGDGNFYGLDYSQGGAPRVLDLDQAEASVHDHGSFDDFMDQLGF